MAQLQSRYLAVVLLIALGALWGLYFAAVKLASVSGIAHVLIITATTHGVALGFVLIAWWRNRWPVLDFAALRFYSAGATVGFLLPLALELWVAEHMDAGLLTLIASLAPICTVVFALRRGREGVSPARALAIGLGLAAALVIVLPHVGLPSAAIAPWAIVAAAIPLLYGWYDNYVASAWPEDHDPCQVACGEMLVAFVLVLPLHLLVQDSEPKLVVSSTGVLAVALIVAVSLIETWLYFLLMRTKGAVFTTQAHTLAVVAGAVWGITLFAEQPTSYLLLGTVLLGGGLWFSAKADRNGEEPERVDPSEPLRWVLARQPG